MTFWSMILPLFLASLLGGQQQPVDGFSISTSSSRCSDILGATTTTTTTTSLHMACWSDSKAVREYQEFLASGEQEIILESDGPSVIVVPNGESSTSEMGEALFNMGMGDDIVVTPDMELPPGLGNKSEYPIYIALPPYQIESFLQTLNPSFAERNLDFVFLAGGATFGNIEDILKNYGYCRDSMTQFLVTGFEITPSKSFKDLSTRIGTDSVGEEKWAGECTVCGKWKGSVMERLERNALRCNVGFYREWRRQMWERNLLDAAITLVGAVRSEPTKQSEVSRYYEAEVSDMMWQISQTLRSRKAVTLLYGFEERIYGVVENTGAEKPCVLDEVMYPYIWGQPTFTDAKMFLEYLWYAKEECGWIPNVQLLPKPTGEATSSIMREGNLRADGVI